MLEEEKSFVILRLGLSLLVSLWLWTSQGYFFFFFLLLEDWTCSEQNTMEYFKLFSFLSPTWNWIFFFFYIYGKLMELQKINLTILLAGCPCSFEFSVLAKPSLQKYVNYSLGFLILKVISKTVSKCECLQSWGQWCVLYLAISYKSKKNY